MFEFFQYPHTDLNQQNLEWLINEMKKLVSDYESYANPVVVKQSSEMTDHNKIYIYMGSQSGFTNSHWYYYDSDSGTWTDGGRYGFAEGDIVPITNGGTGAGNAQQARVNLGTNNASNLTEGTISTDRLPIVPIAKGGTGVASAEQARINLGTNNASNLTEGTISTDRLPIVPIAKGGTGADNAAQARVNLGFDVLGPITAEGVEANQVTINTSSIFKYDKIVFGYIDFTLANNIPEYGNIFRISITETTPRMSAVYPLYTVAKAPTSYTLYNDADNVYYRASGNIPAGRYVCYIMSLFTN